MRIKTKNGWIIDIEKEENKIVVKYHQPNGDYTYWISVPMDSPGHAVWTMEHWSGVERRSNFYFEGMREQDLETAIINIAHDLWSELDLTKEERDLIEDSMRKIANI